MYIPKSLCIIDFGVYVCLWERPKRPEEGTGISVASVCEHPDGLGTKL